MQTRRSGTLITGCYVVLALGACSSTNANPQTPVNTAGVGVPVTAGTYASGAAGVVASAGASGAAGVGGIGTGAAGTGATAGTSGAAGQSGTQLDHFSFFVTSLLAMQRVSGSQNGFGGDLRHGQADGLSGADKICTEIAEASMPGSGQKVWHAFLSVAAGPGGTPVNAIDRVGEGPWYDRLGRLVAMNKAALASNRPLGADAAIVNDLPNEDGVPNHRPDPSQPEVDNHHVLTGSDQSGKLYNGSVNGTCMNWTSAATSSGRPRVGFSWIAGNRNKWISGQDEGGCGAGVNIVESGGSNPNNPIVGSGGGYGAIYCFAMTP